jgi:hypothetical protein
MTQYYALTHAIFPQSLDRTATALYDDLVTSQVTDPQESDIGGCCVVESGPSDDKLLSNCIWPKAAFHDNNCYFYLRGLTAFGD